MYWLSAENINMYVLITGYFGFWGYQRDSTGAALGLWKVNNPLPAVWTCGLGRKPLSLSSSGTHYIFNIRELERDFFWKIKYFCLSTLTVEVWIIIIPVDKNTVYICSLKIWFDPLLIMKFCSFKSCGSLLLWYFFQTFQGSVTAMTVFFPLDTARLRLQGEYVL